MKITLAKARDIALALSLKRDKELAEDRLRDWLAHQVDLDPDYARAVNDNFWDLLL